MLFEAYKISEKHWQLYELSNKPYKRIWLASFNSLQQLLNYYIFCHNLSNDSLRFNSRDLTSEEEKSIEEETVEWKIQHEYVIT